MRKTIKTKVIIYFNLILKFIFLNNAKSANKKRVSKNRKVNLELKEFNLERKGIKI